MVVVDNARKMIGKTVESSVTSVLQTTAGKMIFGRYEEKRSDHHAPAREGIERSDRDPRPERTGSAGAYRSIALEDRLVLTHESWSHHAAAELTPNEGGQTEATPVLDESDPHLYPENSTNASSIT
jgi:hypothetical protein